MQYNDQLTNTCWLDTDESSTLPIDELTKITIPCWCCKKVLGLDNFYFHALENLKFLPLSYCYCEDCYNHFLSFNEDFFLDSNEFASICKECFLQFFFIVDTRKSGKDIVITAKKILPPSKTTKNARKTLN